MGAIVLVGLGVLFLLHTMDILFFSFDRFWPLILIGIGVWLFAKRWGIGGQRAGCTCDRCRARCLMGPAILVVLGVLFLIDHIVSFGRTWPALLIVIGLIKVYQGNASERGSRGNPAARRTERRNAAPVHRGEQWLAQPWFLLRSRSQGRDDRLPARSS